MYDAQLGCGHEEEGHGQLLGKLPRQIETHASEVGVSQEVVQVVRQQLEDLDEVSNLGLAKWTSPEIWIGSANNVSWLTTRLNYKSG